MKHWKIGLVVGLASGLLAGAVLTVSLGQPAQAQEKVKGTAGPRYTVVETEGHNLIVTDNGTNTLYFYTIDKDQPIGSDLKFAPSVDLTQIGKDAIHPKKAKAN